MSDKSLLSLREIARELNFNYKTVLNYKNQIGAFLPGLFDGRNFKYFPDCIEILRLIDALRNEGYTFMMIREIFMQKQTIGNDPHIRDWVYDCLSRFAHHWVKGDGLEQAGMDQIEPVCTSMDADAPECTNMDADKPVCTGSTRNNLVCHNADVDEYEYASTNKSVPDCSDMDEDKREWIRADITSQLPILVNGLVNEKLSYVQAVLSKTLTSILQKLATENNIAITAICEAIEDIQSGIQAVDARLSALEDELGIETEDLADMYRIKAEDLQVSLPTPEFDFRALRDDISKTEEPPQTDDEHPEDPHNLAPVQDSISDGKPDRDTVLQWILSQRNTTPPTSYKNLAAILNDAKIPTLSGRDFWSRGTIRNLAVKAENDTNQN